MTTKYISIIAFFLISISSYCQTSKKDVDDYRIPKDLKSCFPILNKTLSDDEIRVVKTYPEDSIYFHKDFQYGADFFHAWKLYDGSRLTKYFNKKGLVGSHEIYETILISYHRYLNGQPIDLEGQIKKYQAKQKADDEEYLKRTERDTINGVYIPKDIKDCFVTLDSILEQSDIDTIKALPDRDKTIVYHHGLGTWIRNNWGLWGGSRLMAYFLNRGIEHPDSMSALILEYYYDWLNGKNDGWMTFDNPDVQ